MEKRKEYIINTIFIIAMLLFIIIDPFNSEFEVKLIVLSLAFLATWRTVERMLHHCELKAKAEERKKQMEFFEDRK